jgi:hypothetical protein
MWLVKTDANGVMIWNETFGGIYEDRGHAIIQTLDGGFALVGDTRSYGAGNADMWLVKTDANGKVTWHQTFGGSGWDSALSLVQTLDGGFVLLGYTSSFGAGSFDMWLVKTDANGVMIWDQTYGSIHRELGRSVIQTVDGGFALVGDTEPYGANDMWLVKTDANGVMIWNQSYGGTRFDTAYSLVQTLDGGFALVGNTISYGAGNSDMCLVKTDASGKMIWHQSYGTAEDEDGYAVIQTVDGGFALVGLTRSYGNGDMWLVKTSASGLMIWNQTYGGTDFDIAYDLVQTIDGGFALTGYTSSFGAGRIGHHIGIAMYGRTSNLWLVKMVTNGTIQQSSITTSSTSTTISSSTPTPGWEFAPLLVAIAALAIWHRRKRK